jgi:isoleucyl-tRNA synthetase
VDLSAHYLDISKDRLYTFRADSRERRSAQTALYVIADGLTRLIAPIIPMTADEIWAQLPGTRDASVHLAEFPKSPATWIDERLDQQWEVLARLRRSVNKELELKRGLKEIGAPLTAHLTLKARADLYDQLQPIEAELPMLCIVSDVTLARAPEGQENQVEVEVVHATGHKCQRCWRYVPTLVTVANGDSWCPRCEEAVLVA